MSEKQNSRQVFEVVRDYLRANAEKLVGPELKPAAKEVVEFMTESPERFAIVPLLAIAAVAVDPSLILSIRLAAPGTYHEMTKQEKEREVA